LFSGWPLSHRGLREGAKAPAMRLTEYSHQSFLPIFVLRRAGARQNQTNEKWDARVGDRSALYCRVGKRQTEYAVFIFHNATTEGE
jgi:hypothetical protein